jgi:hypothetical protein
MASLMSALGQKQTFAVQKGMCALPPKADMCGATRHVRMMRNCDSSHARALWPPPFFVTGTRCIIERECLYKFSAYVDIHHGHRVSSNSSPAYF